MRLLGDLQFKLSTRGETSWSKEELDTYLKSLIGGWKSAAFFDDFPKNIALFRTWHELCNALRMQAAREHRERWALMGYKAQRDRIFLQTNGTPGTAGRVSHELQQKTLEHARQKGIVGCIGSAHSHPRLGNESPEEDEFSAHDLFSLVVPNGELMTVVVEPSANVFAFRSFETVNVPSGSFQLTQEAFAKYWYEQCGFRYLGQNQAGARATSSFWEETRSVNEAIATRHKLVLYRGKPNSYLKRIFPAPS